MKFTLKTLLILLLFVCKSFSFSQNNYINSNSTGNALENLINKLPVDTFIKIKTYDGSWQAIHPDIIFVDDSIPTFYLTVTPYPEYNDKLENVSIYKSFDGIRFNQIKEGMNPLVPKPAYDHNADPDISYDKHKKQYNILYTEVMRPDSENLILLQSTNIIDWQKKTLLHYKLKKNYLPVLSPSLVNTSDSSSSLFWVTKKRGNRKKEKTYIYIINVSDIENINSQKPKQIKIDLPKKFTAWHLDVFKNSGKYYMLCNGYWGRKPKWGDTSVNKYTLLVFTSSDLLNWTYQYELLNCSEIGDKLCKYTYRSTALIANNTIALWYSYVTSENIWKLGFKKIKLHLD